jgi:hypothetical protein
MANKTAHRSKHSKPEEFPIKGWRLIFYLIGWILGALNVAFWLIMVILYGIKDTGKPFFNPNFHKRVFLWGIFYPLFILLLLILMVPAFLFLTTSSSSHGSNQAPQDKSVNFKTINQDLFSVSYPDYWSEYANYEDKEDLLEVWNYEPSVEMTIYASANNASDIEAYYKSLSDSLYYRLNFSETEHTFNGDDLYLHGKYAGKNQLAILSYFKVISCSGRRLVMIIDGIKESEFEEQAGLISQTLASFSCAK